jgi:hypothetical protein
VTVDIEALLRRVVEEVFDADVAAEWLTEPRDRHSHQVRLTSADGDRHVGLRASYWWFDVKVFDLDVRAFLIDEDDDEAEKADALRALALVARAYLRDGGRVEWRRGLFGSRRVLSIVVDGHEWELGRRSCRTPV